MKNKNAPTCFSCKHWNFFSSERSVAQFGKCTNHLVFSWVRGDSFEPPADFGCNNHSDFENED